MGFAFFFDPVISLRSLKKGYPSVFFWGGGILDVTYEYQTGFDFRIRGQREFEVFEDAVDLTSTYSAIDWSDQNESNI